MVRTPSARQFQAGVFKWIGGELYKRCTGPAHDEPFVYLPATDKYFYEHKSGEREGKLTARCRLCNNWSKIKNFDQNLGWIPVREARPFYLEAANRVGAMELANRSGLSYRAVTNVLWGRTKFVQRRTLKKVMLELVSIKRKNEYSISIHAAWRVTKRDRVERCSGCGTPTDTYVDGCKPCIWRKNGREARARLTTT